MQHQQGLCAAKEGCTLALQSRQRPGHALAHTAASVIDARLHARFWVVLCACVHLPDSSFVSSVQV